MKVVFLARSLDVGGAETQLVSLAASLRGEFEVQVVTFYPGGALQQVLREANIPSHCVDKRRRWDLVGFAMSLRQLLRRLRPDLIQSFLGPPNVIAALLKPRSTRLVWGVRASDMDLAHYDWTHRLVFRGERLLSSIPDWIVANSSAGRAHVAKAGFPPARIRVIPNGIDTQRFRPDDDARATGRALLSAAGPLIGMVARLDPMKDHATFLRAAAILAERRPDARFVCVGGGRPEFQQDLRHMAAAMGVADMVIWTGERRDVAAILNALDVATLSSAFGEGFPNAVGEAMACAVPCVATDVGDAAEVIGECGVIVPRRDPAALAAGWEKVLAMSQGERAHLGLAARRRIGERFSVARMVETTAALYREALQAA